MKCVHCDKQATQFGLCSGCFDLLSYKAKVGLASNAKDALVTARNELQQAGKGFTGRGFVNGRAFWETFLQCPVSRDCTVKVQFTGEMSIEGMDRLLELLTTQRNALRKEIEG